MKKVGGINRARSDQQQVEGHHLMKQFLSKAFGRSPSIPNKILVVKLDHIGDFVIAEPALALIQRLFPNSRITLLCQPVNAELAQFMFPRFEILTHQVFPERISQGIGAASSDHDGRSFWRSSQSRYDLAIDFRFEPDTLTYLRFSPSKVKIGFSRGERFLSHKLNAEQLRLRLPAMRDRIKELALEVGRLFACTDAGAVYESRLSSLRSTEEDYFVIAPGAGNDLKIWPIDRFSEVARALCERLNLDVVLIGNQADIGLGLEFQRLASPTRIRNLIGKTTLLEVAKLIGSAKFLIGNDSGAVHIAASIGVPTVSIHSGQDLQEIWAPDGPNVITLSSETECAPCNLRQRIDCKFAVRCLTQIETGDVCEAVSRLLGVNSFEKQTS
jgi:ADP-heptose:LPS heptosyltransferase